MYLADTCGKTMRTIVVSKNGQETTCWTAAHGASRSQPCNYPLVYARTAVC